MNKYTVLSSHDVYEDSYTEGEGTWVKGYDLGMKVSAKDPMEAVAKFYDKQLGKEFDPTIVNIEDGGIYDSFLVDVENLEATENQIEKWKRGEIMLYANSFRVIVQSIEVLDLEEYFKK